MKRFAALYRRLDETTKTSRKLAALEEYFATVPAADAAWAVYFLSGRKPTRLVLARDLRQWCVDEAAVPGWLLDECHDAVGDFAETMALLLSEPVATVERPLHVWVEEHLLPLRRMPAEEQRGVLIDAWRHMDRDERLVWNKLLTGEFRIGVSQSLVVKALAEIGKIAPAAVAHRLMGQWQPNESFFKSLVAEATEDTDFSRPYPFCLAHPIDEPATLGDARPWLIEWKWDGIRAQAIRRGETVALWSRGEELITERFPEVAEATARLPAGTVLDGEVVGWREGAVLPFGDLQRRIGRKALGKKILTEVPAAFIAFDVLEVAGRDVRERPLAERRAALEKLLGNGDDRGAILISPSERVTSWDEVASLREESRGRNVEGLMLKALDSPYGVGRVTGLWWKWKVAPHTVDAVLIYAQKGSGRRASLFTDYTFALWDAGQLVPFAKAYSGLNDEEIAQVDRFVRQNTLETFGPVRRVKPELVFELAFENVQVSNRHKIGVAVRFPRMVRWRTDKTPAEADSIEVLRGLVKVKNTAVSESTAARPHPEREGD